MSSAKRTDGVGADTGIRRPTGVEEPLAVPGAGDPTLPGGRPNFLLIGAAKSGTTSLWAYLRQHPEVYLPDTKEPSYFAFDSAGPSLEGPAEPSLLAEKLYGRVVTDPRAYLRLFEDAPPGSAIGEASVRYLYYPEAARRIAAAVPDVRLVAVLRNPADRLVSHYEMNRAAGLEPLGLNEALLAEDGRVAAGWGWDWHYVRVGLYAQQVARYLRLFDPAQLLVLEYAQFRDRPLETYVEVCRHLGVAHSCVPDISRRSKESYNARIASLDSLFSAGALSTLARRALPDGLARTARRRLRDLNRAPKVTLDDSSRQALALRFDPDVADLEDLLHRSMPSLRTLT